MSSRADLRRRVIHEARELKRAGEHEAAARSFRRADALRPLQRTALLEFARALAAAGDSHGALRLMPRLEADENLWRGGGRLAMKLQAYDVAEGFWLRIETKGPDVEARLQRARLHVKLSRWEDAADAASDLLAIQPDHQEARHLLRFATGKLVALGPRHTPLHDPTSPLRDLAGLLAHDPPPASTHPPDESGPRSTSPPRTPTHQRERLLATGFCREVEGDCVQAFLAFALAEHLASDLDGRAALARMKDALLQQAPLSSDLISSLMRDLHPILRDEHDSLIRVLQEGPAPCAES